MDKIVVEGGARLNGSVKVSGAKNATLPILFSTLLTSGKHTFLNVPHLHDVRSTFDLLKSLNSESSLENHRAVIEIKESKNLEAHYDLVRKMRASVLCLGPLVARYGFARVSLPGGCAIGARPIDLHLAALEKMGAQITIEAGYVEARVKKLKGTTIKFDLVTVTGTENIMMAATLAEGTTVLQNAALEPEVVDLAHYLKAMGAKIKGEGTGTITIEGVSSLKPPAEFSIMPDRIEAGTLLIAGAITGGAISIEGFDPVIIEALTEKMRLAGFKIESLMGAAQGLKIEALAEWRATDVTTEPYPHFATDLQAQFMALMCFAKGTTHIRETIFENRFMHVQELTRLGASIQIKNQLATILGKPHGLTGAPVMATDLRASASLVLAGLAAKGKTTVNRIYHLDRGYENLELKLKSLGARIQRSPE